MTFITLSVLAMLLCAGLLTAYGMFRVARTPSSGDALAGVRLHGRVTAMAALLFSTLSASQGLSHFTEGTTDGVPVEWANGWMTMPVRLDPGWQVPLIVLLPPALMALVYVVAQQTFPRPRGSVRRASLAPRSAGRILPMRLTVLACLVGLTTLAFLILLWQEPSAPGLIAPEAEWGDEPTEITAHQALAAGSEVVTWLLLALLAIAAALAVGLLAISRRRAVEGLSPDEDRATREVAANRLLRTGVWMLWTLAGSAWAAIEESRIARNTLARVLPEHPAALSLAGVDWVPFLSSAGAVLTLPLIVVLLLWRSPALHVLRPAAASPTAHPSARAGEPA